MGLYTGIKNKWPASLWPFATIIMAVLFLVITGRAPADAAPQQGVIGAQPQPGVMGAQDQGGNQGGIELQDNGGGVNVQVEENAGAVQAGAANQQEQAYEQPQDLGDIPDNEDMVAFDPSTVPDSVFPEDADWAFNVPINVTNLPPQVKKLGITCETLYWKGGGQIRDGRWSDAGGEWDRVDCGYAKRRIDLVDGGYVGNIIIGVQMTPGAANNVSHSFWLAREYECKMYLVGDLPGEANSWEIPQTSPVSPFWRRADANQPFLWWTGRQPIPVAARPNPPWADAESSGNFDGMGDAVGGIAGQAGGQESGASGGDAQSKTPADNSSLPLMQNPN